MTELSKPLATARKTMIGAHVVADMRTRWVRDLEQYAQQLERDCSDFHDHCRDHRSLDHVRLEVVREYEIQCSACSQKLESVHDPELNDGRLSCAGCGAEISEEKAS